MSRSIGCLLLERQQQIENGPGRRHLQDRIPVLYDDSSSYFEGWYCPLGQYGRSRDHPRDRPQVVCRLLCTREGLPVAVEVFDGNTVDPFTVSNQVKTLEDRLGIGRVVLVGDRGMIALARIAEALKPVSLDWIICQRAPAIQATAAEGVNAARNLVLPHFPCCWELCRVHHTCAEEFEAGASIHRSLEHLQAADLSFDGTSTSSQ
jgi:hypothetical protein